MLLFLFVEAIYVKKYVKISHLIQERNITLLLLLPPRHALLCHNRALFRQDSVKIEFFGATLQHKIPFPAFVLRKLPHKIRYKVEIEREWKAVIGYVENVVVLKCIKLNVGAHKHKC
jgi:hypothetical protein